MNPPEAHVLREPVIVHGLSIRTTNADEAEPARAKIPALWERFYQEGHSAAVEGPVYGVYTDYATDASGPYTLVIGGGGDVRSAPVSPLVRVQIPAGRYLAFTSKGEAPAAVLAGWQGIWDYFARPDAPRRACTTDFEVYDPAALYEVRICIAFMLG